MKIDRGPILGALVMAVVLSLAACVSPFEPEGEPDVEEQDPDADFRAGQAYLWNAGPPDLWVTNG